MLGGVLTQTVNSSSHTGYVDLNDYVVLHWSEQQGAHRTSDRWQKKGTTLASRKRKVHCFVQCLSHSNNGRAVLLRVFFFLCAFIFTIAFYGRFMAYTVKKVNKKETHTHRGHYFSNISNVLHFHLRAIFIYLFLWIRNAVRDVVIWCELVAASRIPNRMTCDVRWSDNFRSNMHWSALPLETFYSRPSTHRSLHLME